LPRKRGFQVKIAIVEDDINMRKSLEIAMSDFNEFEIKTFKNAKDALKQLDESFELVITDINMPGMDGIEFVKTLNGRYEVIIMTGNATLQRAIDSIHLGVKDFLLKPFEIDTLVDAIKRESKIQKSKNKNSLPSPRKQAATKVF
jgi:Response regulator containing CheY-like receiver, AAA-type ATPase, and DNA-binding domains